ERLRAMAGEQRAAVTPQVMPPSFEQRCEHLKDFLENESELRKHNFIPEGELVSPAPARSRETSSRDELLHAATKHMAELYARTDAGRGRGLMDEVTLLARHWGEMAGLLARGELRLPDTAMAASASGLATNGQHFHD